MNTREKFWTYLNTHDENEINRTTIVQFWARADNEMTARAAQLEAERDEWKRLHRMLTIAGIELVHERDSYIADLRRYQAEREQLLARAEELAAELRECMNANTLSAQAQDEVTA